MKKNFILWVAALVVINTGWYNLSQQSVSQEINRPGADFAEIREAKIGGIIGDEADFEIKHCFESSNGGIYNVSIRIDQGTKTIYSWNGTTENDCVKFKSSSQKGEITIITQLEEGALATTNLKTWPFKEATYLGMIVFSLGMISIAYGESFVRKLIKKKIEKTISKKPVEIEANESSYSAPTGIWQDPLKPR